MVKITINILQASAGDGKHSPIYNENDLFQTCMLMTYLILVMVCENYTVSFNSYLANFSSNTILKFLQCRTSVEGE